MTNYEFYREELEDIKTAVVDRHASANKTYCDFVQNKILRGKCAKHEALECESCRTIFLIWLLEEHKEQETDWSKVEVDAPVLVRDFEDAEWNRRHFAKYENGLVWTYLDGRTSWSGSDTTSWKYARLAEEEKQ